MIEGSIEELREKVRLQVLLVISAIDSDSQIPISWYIDEIMKSFKQFIADTVAKSTEEHSDWLEEQLDASYLAGQEKGCADTIEEIKKAVEKAGDLSKFGSASGEMMKGSMLKYLDQLKDNKEKL